MLEPERAIYGLLKFGDRQHLEELRNEGLLYMRSLAEFAKLESDMARGDCFEGTTRIFQPKHIKNLVIPVGIEWRVDVDEVDAGIGQLLELFQIVAAVDDPRVEK
jgi:hypothetical protein